MRKRRADAITAVAKPAGDKARAGEGMQDAQQARLLNIG